jgi:HSP20 family protein
MNALQTLEQELSRAFFNDVDSRITWKPPVTVSESDDSYIIEMELSGMAKEDIKVRYEEDILIVEGERKEKPASEVVKVWRNERSVGKFSRTFRLINTIDPETIQANMSQGLLTISLSKSEKAKTRMITVGGE